MSVSRSGYYKWKYRQEHPTMKTISRQTDIDLMQILNIKANIINGKSLMKNMKHLIILFGMVGNIYQDHLK